MGRVIVVGYLSIDDIAVGGAVHHGVAGGAALYGALGARLGGADVALVAMAGEDFPQVWLDALAGLGIDLAHVRRGPGPTRRARLRHAPDGCRASPHHREDAWMERTRALAPAPPAGLPADAIMLAPMPPETLEQAIDMAKAPVVADTSEAFADVFAADAAALGRIAPRLAIFAPSLAETRGLLPGLTDDDALRALAALGSDIVQKRGAGGLALCRARDDAIALVPAPATTVIDPTGAGDATVGALAAGLARRLPLFDNAQQAAAIGARAVAGIGPAALGLDVSPLH